MNIEFLTGKMLGKEIKIETFDKDGNLGILIDNLKVDSVEIIKTMWAGYNIKVNENINLYFDSLEPCDYNDLEYNKHCLCLFRDDVELVNVYLPEGDSWNEMNPTIQEMADEINTKIIDTKINLCNFCIFCPAECLAKEEDVKYGDGYGLDNIYKCKTYVEAW